MYVYEHGIVRERPIKGSNLRKIATDELPPYSGYTLTILDLTGESLIERAVKLGYVDGPSATEDFLEHQDLRYCVLAMMYHLNRVINLYVEVAELFEQLHNNVTEGNTGGERIFWEVDSFLTTSQRVYEYMSSVLWKHYGSSSPPWRGLYKAVKDARIPSEFCAEIKMSLDTWSSLRAYSNSIVHHRPLAHGSASCWTRGYEGRWGASIRLPSNPNVQTRRSYGQGDGPDALDYCHRLACHLVELCEHLESLPEVRYHLDHPEEGAALVKLSTPRLA